MIQTIGLLMLTFMIYDWLHNGWIIYNILLMIFKTVAVKMISNFSWQNLHSELVVVSQ